MRKLAIILALILVPALAFAQAPSIDASGTYGAASGATSHTGVLPTGSGGELYAFVCMDSDSATSYALNGSSATWNEHVTSPWSTAGGEAELVLYYRTSTGSDSFVFDPNVNEKVGIVIHRVSGGATGEPDASTGATGNSLNPNSDSLSPAGGSDDYLWLSAFCYDIGSSTGWTGGEPAGYNTLVSGEATGGGSVDMVTADIDPSGSQSSHDPGAWTGSGSSQQWVAITVAITPDAPESGCTQGLAIGGAGC